MLFKAESNNYGILLRSGYTLPTCLLMLICVRWCALLQYCEYSPNPSKCYEWMKANLPDCYTRLVERGKKSNQFVLFVKHSPLSVFVVSPQCLMVLGGSL